MLLMYFSSDCACELLPQLYLQQMLIQSEHDDVIFVVKITPMVIVYHMDTLKRHIIWEIIKIQILTSTPIIHGEVIIQILIGLVFNIKILIKKLLKIHHQSSLLEATLNEFKKMTQHNLKALNFNKERSNKSYEAFIKNHDQIEKLYE